MAHNFQQHPHLMYQNSMMHSSNMMQQQQQQQPSPPSHQQQQHYQHHNNLNNNINNYVPNSAAVTTTTMMQNSNHMNQFQPSQHYEVDQLTRNMNSMSMNQGWNQLWQSEAVNLLTEKDLRSKYLQEKFTLQQQLQTQKKSSRDFKSCDNDVMHCTLRKIPDCASLLQKSRLPFGVLLHPFKNDSNIPVLQDSVIVRCRSCRTYINPYVRLLDQRRWQCNLCHRINEVPEEFVYDYHSRQHIDITTRPELNYGSIEYVASVEYMVRPPQPATYVFVFECTASAVQTGYIKHFSEAMLQSLDKIPGDSRTLIGFIAFDAKLHFFNLNENGPVHLIMPDIQDIFLPHADCLLVNFQSCREKIEHFLAKVLPTFPFDPTSTDPTKNIADHESALGPALQVAFKIVSPTGGRITLIQTSLPSAGNLSDGCVLQNREDPNQRTINSSNSGSALTPLLNPVTDFFKKLALECSEHQVSVDLFNLSSSFSDLATVQVISKYSGGSIQYYGGGYSGNPMALSAMLTRFKEDMKHYLTRSIGFEAVMRLRATRGISIHTFHGNFFVRSTDLIALPNVNPDSSYGIQLSITEDLKEFNQVCFQAALLYTTPQGERRIRVHTLALPVVSVVNDVINSANQEVILSLLAKMAVDRSCQSSIQDAREAMINANIDLISAFRLVNTPQYPGLFISDSSKLLPLYTLAMLKHTAFRFGISTRIDDRVYAMEKMKSLPLKYLILYIYPNLYALHHQLQFDPNITDVPTPSPLQLSFANIDRNGVYLLDTYDHLFIYICKSVHPQFLSEVLNVTQWSQIPDDGDQNPALTNQTSNPKLTTGNQPQQVQMNGYHSHQLSSSSSFQNDINLKSELNDFSPKSSGDDSQNSSQESQKPCPIVTLPVLDNPTSRRIHKFIDSLLIDRPFKPSFHILREDSRLRYSFLQYMFDDRNESAFSYYEFLQHLQQNLEK